MLDRVSAALGTISPAPAIAGIGTPTAASELPAVVVSAVDIEERLTGIGSRPAPSRRGALAIDDDFDLTDPVAVFADGSEVALVSLDRATFFLPFGPAVSSDGIELVTLGSADITVAIDSVAQTIVSGDPAAGEVRANAQLGTLDFGTPLPATGQLNVSWFLGEWEVTVHRFQGTLAVDVYAATVAEINTISRAIETILIPEALGGISGLQSASPRFFGPVGSPQEAVGSGRLRRIEFKVDAEIEDPVLLGGGGLISRVDVDSTFGSEVFSIPVEVGA